MDYTIFLRKNLFFLISFLHFSTIHSQVSELDIYEHYDYSVKLSESTEPIVKDGFLYLTYKGSPNVRYVAVIFNFENYEKRHVFFKNANNVFFLKYKLPSNLNSDIKYKLIIDNLMNIDPKNTYTKDILLNEQVSLIPSRYTYSEPTSSPKKIGSNVYKFYLKKQSNNANVYLIGNFNNWNAFINKFEQDSDYPNFLSVTITINLKDIFYYFLKNGSNILDNLNEEGVYMENFPPISSSIFNMNYYKSE